MTGLEIKRVPLDSIHPDPANARKHGPENLEAIVGSLKRFGQAEPLVVQKVPIRRALGAKAGSGFPSSRGHGGEIRAESDGEGKGSTFTVTFPVVDRLPNNLELEPEHVPAAPAAEVSETIRGVRILVVDDEADTRSLLHLLLSKFQRHLSKPVVPAGRFSARRTRRDRIR